MPVLLSALLASAVTSAAPAEAPSAATSLAQAPYWQRLLRDATPDDGQYRSQITRSGFFLAARGAQDAEAELQADLSAFAAGGGDESPACRFPARRAWLAQQLPDVAAGWVAPRCQALDAWLKALDARQATLVFASDYLNNPSSMFGHTLLRIDAASQRDDTRLLAYAVNYSAQTNTSNGLEFAVKGLTGGYPGRFSLLPYYEKVKEYNDWESRDLWEYELALTPEEVHRLLLAYWDWRETEVPYYFLSRNCSYELLGLLEMARPGLKLQDKFPGSVIPTDTLRAVLAEPGMLRRTTWRAASGTRRQAAIDRNSLRVNLAVPALMRELPPVPPAQLAPEEQAQALETAYDELYVRYLARAVDKDSTPPQLRALLTRRSQLDIPDQRVVPAQPLTGPTGGHETARWGLGYGHDADDLLLLHYRPAYHDWLDAQTGYRTGARIDFLSGTLGVDREGRLSLQDASVVAIDSLAPASSLHQPWSWSVRAGATQALAGDGQARNHGLGVVEGGGGIALRAGADTLCHVQSHSDARGGASLDRGWELGTGLRAGCLGGGHAVLGDWRWLLEARALYRWPSLDWDRELRGGLQLSPARNQALRIELRAEQRDVSLTTLGVSWLHYF